MKNFKQYLVEAVGKFMTGDVEIKGKRVKVEVEVTGVDNKQRIYHANVLAPKEHFGLELKIPAKVMHSGKWIKTKTGKAFEGYQEDQNLADLVGGEDAVKRAWGLWPIVKAEMTGEKQLLQRMYVDEVDQPYIPSTHM